MAPSRLAAALAASAAALAILSAPAAEACSTFLVGKGASADGSVMATHSDDGEGRNDPRLVYVPAKTYKPGEQRAVYPDTEDYPRYVGADRGRAYAPAPGQVATEPIGYIPQVASTYAYFDSNYAVLNEKQVGIGESTCSGKFAAKGAHQGGKALFSVNALSRVALERCATARCAVQTMGDLAVTHGFYGASAGFEGSAESLLVTDTNEGWVFHVLPDSTGTSAVWVAKRVPDGHVTVVMNMFTVRDVNLTDTANCLGSANMHDIAKEQGWWDPSMGLLDFTKTFSDGEYAHKYYSGRRMWGAFRKIAPSVKLPAEYGNLRDDAPYPWSLPPDDKVSPQDLMAWHREYYAGTPYSLSDGLAAGPYGNPDRVTAGAGEAKVKGAWERPIALFRTTYSFVVQCRGWLADDVGGTVWFGPHASLGTVYVPFAIGVSDLPWSYQTGNQSVLDRGAAWWAHRYVYNLAKGLRWDVAGQELSAAQGEYESKGAALQAEVDGMSGQQDKITEAYFEHARSVLDGWWALGDKLMLRLADGFVDGDAVGYPEWWLRKVGYEDGPPPVPPHHVPYTPAAVGPRQPRRAAAA